jgi:hypothetical protein
VKLALAFVLAAGVSATSCRNPPQHVLSVRDYIASIDRLNGQRVSVGGYLGRCGGYDCILFAGKDDFQRMQRWVAAAGRDHKRPNLEVPDFLGVGSAAGFDERAAAFAGRYVVITGTVDKSCRGHGMWRCRDRGGDIHPEAIEPAQPPAAVPKAAHERKA